MRLNRFVTPTFWLLCGCLWFIPMTVRSETIPDDFVYVEESIPEIRLDLRYFSDNNFVGQRIDGYLQPRCILTRKAAVALREVQEELEPFGLGLKIYDAYRPQQAVDHFVRWAKDVCDTRMKNQFYPQVEKENLFRDGYIAAKSSHSRGSTVDVTIVSLGGESPGIELDMGSIFDFFGRESWPDNPSVLPGQRAHRLLLQTLMKNHGFQPYPQEWWHFTLKDEPYPQTYFNFPVR
ncbi:MAG TPA: peptidase M15 [Syntrophobacteraceae bacterium]|jgi:zinc D-Ala-D-Ala dipeptidase|nr:peptidase M15 [Syntrophobacteraceae bacterium]HBZ54036.1 peptidase M15 [Syntrophobacteraceae bacterium]